MHGGNTNVCTYVTLYFSFRKWREGEEAARPLVPESTVNVKKHISKPHKTMECVRTRSPSLAHTFAQVVSNFLSEYLKKPRFRVFPMLQTFSQKNRAVKLQRFAAVNFKSFARNDDI